MALAVILAAKFTQGAWLTVFIIPCTIFLLRTVRRYYDGVERQVLRDGHRRIDLRHHTPPIVLVPIKQWDRLTRKTLEYALRLSADVTALHVTAREGPAAQDREQKLRCEWRECVEEPARQSGLQAPRLEFVRSEFRSMTAPLLRVIRDVQHASTGRPVTVVLPELVDGRWWGTLMHAHRERRLRTQLLRHASNVVVSSVPWQLQAASPEQTIADEEPSRAPL